MLLTEMSRLNWQQIVFCPQKNAVTLRGEVLTHYSETSIGTGEINWFVISRFCSIQFTVTFAGADEYRSLYRGLCYREVS